MPIALIALAIGGCASTKVVPLSAESAAALEGRRIGASEYETPDFSAFTAGKAMFGLVGAALMISAGNRIVSENAVEDPAGEIAASLAGRMAEVHGMTVSGSGSGAVLADGSVGSVAERYDDADYVMDVRTVNWSFLYFPTDWSRYRVLYSAKLRLVETRGGQVIAEGFCKRVPDYTDDAPTREELLANEAARLKSELATARALCDAQFRDVLGLARDPAAPFSGDPPPRPLEP